MDEEEKDGREERRKYAEDVIDDDLYEEFSDEELLVLVEEAKRNAWKKAAEREKGKHVKPIIPKWFFWLIAVAMIFNLIALLPQTFSIPALDFLKASTSLSMDVDVKQYKESVVVIEAGDSKGTGFSYGDGDTVLTNYHVVDDFETVTVIFPEAGLLSGNVVETYPDIDLALIEVETKQSLPALDLAASFTLDKGEKVYFIGNPLKFSGIANKGTILDYVTVKGKDDPVVIMDAPVYRGNSGSPVINKDGKVIGIVFATMFHDEEGRVGLFIPIDYFYDKNVGLH